MQKRILSFGALLLLLIVACAPKKYYKGKDVNIKTYVVKDSVGVDTSIVNFLLPYKLRLDSLMNVVVGASDVPLTKAQPESTMGNFVADAQLAGGKKLNNLTSISVVNYGGIRIPFLSKGEILKGKIYEMMPFDNTLTLIDVPGDVLEKFCNHIALRKGWPISGFSFLIKDNKAVDIKIGGEPLNPNLVYKLVTSDYIANGGDDCEFLVPLKKFTTTIFLRDALIQYLQAKSQAGQAIHPTLENRISYAE